MQRRAAIVISAIVAGLLAGCGIGVPTVPHLVALTDRCADVVTAAVPFEIDVKSRTSENAGIDKIIAHVAAVRTDLPKDSPATRDFAAECTFDNSTLSAFRWTKGGPRDLPGQSR